MKKRISYFLLIVFLIQSCNSDDVTISKEEYLKLKKDTTKYLIVNETEYLIYTGSDGHQYYGTQLGTGGYGFSEKHFHLPDCKKCLTRIFHVESTK